MGERFRSSYRCLNINTFVGTAHCTFLHKRNTPTGNKICVVLRVPKDVYESAGGREIVELVFTPRKYLGYTKFNAALVCRDGDTEYGVPSPYEINRFIYPRQITPGDSYQKNVYYTPKTVGRMIQGFCECCGHIVHPKLRNAHVVLRHLEALAAENSEKREAASE